MSSGWDNEFRFSQYAVAFQCFRMKYLLICLLKEMPTDWLAHCGTVRDIALASELGNDSFRYWLVQTTKQIDGLVKDCSISRLLLYLLYRAFIVKTDTVLKRTIFHEVVSLGRFYPDCFNGVGVIVFERCFIGINHVEQNTRIEACQLIHRYCCRDIGSGNGLLLDDTK